ncbi:helix-turn-helix domain-containing protein [Bacillus altitudinis]|uniref:helix-turn-helix domain-containing protein n=1 Tax=Bacillus altitudinis TaxID=293387 RepID=UPI002236ABC4|nr:helix-turn-helix domain-containing protein [Bacillus altitudinis]MCW4359520.1 helix-turn-helix domain-containing protein [Bacillus altitudinis]
MYGKRIRELRKEKGMTLRELSEELNIPFTTLGNYEREDRQPRFDTLKAIADYFQVTIDYLTGGNAENWQSISDKREFLTLSNLEVLGVEVQYSTTPGVKEVALNFLDGVKELMFGELKPENIQEIELQTKVINFLVQLKKGFPTINSSRSSAVNSYDFTKRFHEEKIELDKCLYELFQHAAEKHTKV